MPKGKVAAGFKMVILDPNTTEQKVFESDLTPTFNPALFATVVREKIAKSGHEKRIKKSLKYGILDSTTALIVFEKIQEPSGNESELVRIPLPKLKTFTGSGSMELYVKTLTGKTITIHMDQCATI